RLRSPGRHVPRRTGRRDLHLPVGRKRTFLACVTWFSVLMVLCAAAPGPEFFAVVRFLAGIGLGGVMPLAAAFTTEFAPT
ncbi:MAG: MFS transporter, partial [Corynebacterium variabile]|uniref:MFS transporter n=1 Tax=Corynebacterium variabile TaxID=1727 RepID=UPI003F906EA7